MSFSEGGARWGVWQRSIRFITNLKKIHLKWRKVVATCPLAFITDKGSGRPKKGKKWLKTWRGEVSIVDLKGWSCVWAVVKTWKGPVEAKKGPKSQRLKLNYLSKKCCRHKTSQSAVTQAGDTAGPVDITVKEFCTQYRVQTGISLFFFYCLRFKRHGLSQENTSVGWLQVFLGVTGDFQKYTSVSMRPFTPGRRINADSQLSRSSRGTRVAIILQNDTCRSSFLLEWRQLLSWWPRPWNGGARLFVVHCETINNGSSVRMMHTTRIRVKQVRAKRK